MSIEQEYKIQNIRNLEMIYFYDVSKSDAGKLSSPFLGLKIVYDGGKGLGYDITSKYFDKFIGKVISVYKNESHNQNIEFLDDFSKNMMKQISTDYFNDRQDNNYLNQSLIDKHSEYNEVMKVENYIKDICKSVLSFILKNHKIDVIKLKGHNNRFCAIYSIDGLVTKTLSMIVKKSSLNKYEFKMIYVSDNVYSIDGSMIFDDSYVNIEWKCEDTKGTCNYNIDSNLSEKTIRNKEKLVDFSEVKKNVDTKEKILLDFYTKEFLQEEFDTCVPTVENNYLLLQYKLIDGDFKDRFYKKISCHASIKKDSVRLVCRILNGVSKNDNKLLIPFKEEEKEIFARKFSIDDKNYVVVETKKSPVYTDSNALIYQDKKYYYDILETENFSDFTKSFKIKSRNRVNNNENKNLLLKLTK